MFYLFVLGFVATYDGNYLKIKYDGKLNKEGLKIFYEIHTKDTILSDYSDIKRENFFIRIPLNPYFILFYFEDTEGIREPEVEPFEYVFKGEGNNLKYANYLLNRRNKNYEKALYYIEKEKNEYPENKWVRYYEFWIKSIKNESYNIIFDDIKDEELSNALKILNDISKNTDYKKELIDFLKKFPNSIYNKDLLSEIDINYIPEIFDSLKINNIKIPAVASFMLYYVLQRVSPKDTIFKNILKELYKNYDFEEKNMLRNIIFNYLEWKDIKELFKLDDVFEVKDPLFLTDYAYELLKNNDYSNALKVALKAYSIYKDDYHNRRLWNYKKERRERERKESYCFLFSIIAKCYYELNNIRKAKKFIELSLQNETEDFKTEYNLAGDIYSKIGDYEKANEYYLVHYIETRDTISLNKLKKTYKGDDFEKYISDGKKSILKKKMLNRPAKDFSLPDLKGDTIRLSELKGKVVFLNFWATWCGPCKREIPYLNIIYEKYRNNPNILFYGITDEDKDKVEDFLKKKEHKFHILLGNIKELYDVYGVPTNILIDKNGFIQFRHVGFNEQMGEMFLKEIGEEIDFLLE
uniref:TlpA family protein disulfide reductase n=1 Tax=candidate division WOR-3 bacterium TaxID=2052148 RepID=A0A7C4YER9_UNCW3